jgi:predicted nucleic acid-binding protein
MFLLDTDTLIYLLKGQPEVMRSLRQHENDPIKASVITLMELYYGAYKSERVTANLAKIKALENALEVVPLGPEAVEIFGLQKAELESSGTPLDDFDLAIAVTALAHNLTLVTNNIRHFHRVDGLRLENWTEEP